MKLKLITAASCLAAASFANAAIEDGANGLGNPANGIGGEFILSVWDVSASTSYTLDLGGSTKTFDSNGSYTYDFTNDANWQEFAATMEGDDIYWDVAASDRMDTNAQNDNGFMTTAKVGADDNVTGLQIGLYNSMQSAVEMYAYTIDGLDDNYAENKSYFLSGGDNAGNTGVWGSFNGMVDWAQAQYGVDTEMEFWQMTSDVTYVRNRPFPLAVHNKLAGTWTLADGQLTYSTAAIPVPAAVWLFGSALAGLVGVSRRRKQA